MKTKMDVNMANWLSGLSYCDRPEPLYGIDLLDPKVYKAAIFAILDYNLKMKANFKLIMVEKAASMVVGAGIVFYLIFTAAQLQDVKVFITAVLVVDDEFMDSVGLQEYTLTSETAEKEYRPHHRRISPTHEIETLAKDAVNDRNDFEKDSKWKFVDVLHWKVLSHSEEYCTLEVSFVAQKSSSLPNPENPEVEYWINDVIASKWRKPIRSPIEEECSKSRFHLGVAPKLEKSLDVPLLSPLEKFLGVLAVKEHNRIYGTELEFVDCISMGSDVENAGLKYYITLQAIDEKIHKIFSTEAVEVNTLGLKTELNISDVLDDIEDQKWVSTEMNYGILDVDDIEDVDDVEEPNSLVFTKLKYVSNASPNPKPQVVLPYASPNWISSQFLNQVNKHAWRQPNACGSLKILEECMDCSYWRSEDYAISYQQSAFQRIK